MNPAKLKSTHEEVLRLSALVKDLELLSHYDAETMKLSYSRENLKNLVSQIVRSFEPALAEKKIVFEIHGRDIEIKTDKNKLSQVFNNLLSNSLEYTPEKGHIGIHLAKEHEACEIIIKDNGIGIPEKDQPHVFERFYKSDKAHTIGKNSGTGLGLSICKRIIEMHGQTIRLVPMQKGAAFEFTLRKAPIARKANNRSAE